MQVILDVEATGVNGGVKFDEPVEIAVADIEGNSLFRTYVKPTVAIDPEATEVTGIDEAFLETVGAPTFEEIADQLREVLSGATEVIAWNAGYDMRVLDNAFLEWSGSMFVRGLKWVDAMRPYSAKFGRKNSKTNDFAWMKLGSAYEHHVGWDAYSRLQEAHNALVDCRILAELLRVPDSDIKTCAPDNRFKMSLVKAKNATTGFGKPYIRFQTAGGLELNVFSNKYSSFEAQGWNLNTLAGVIRERQPDPTKWYTLSNPIKVTIRYTDEWPEVETVYPRGHQSS